MLRYFVFLEFQKTLCKGRKISPLEEVTFQIEDFSLATLHSAVTFCQKKVKPFIPIDKLCFFSVLVKMILWILLVLEFTGCESNLSQCKDLNCDIVQKTLNHGNATSQYFSKEQVCDLLDVSLLFGKTDDIVILTENEHYKNELYMQPCLEKIPHTIWLIPKLIQKQFFENSIEKWLRDGIQKFVILCSIECTSLLLELTKNLLISDLEPLLFITSRQPMYFLGSLPSMVVAVENDNSGR